MGWKGEASRRTPAFAALCAASSGERRSPGDVNTRATARSERAWFERRDASFVSAGTRRFSRLRPESAGFWHHHERAPLSRTTASSREARPVRPTGGRPRSSRAVGPARQRAPRRRTGSSRVNRARARQSRALPVSKATREPRAAKRLRRLGPGERAARRVHRREFAARSAARGLRATVESIESSLACCSLGLLSERYPNKKTEPL